MLGAGNQRAEYHRKDEAFHRHFNKVLHDTHQVEGRVVLAHDNVVIPHHDGRLDDDVHAEIDQEGSDHDAGCADLRTVETQRIEQRTGNFRNDEWEEIYARGEQDAAEGIRDNCRNNGDYRAEHRRAVGVYDEGRVDAHFRTNRNADHLQGNTQRDHQRRKHQHLGLFEFAGGLLPIGLGKGRFVQGCIGELCIFRHEKNLLSEQTSAA